MYSPSLQGTSAQGRGETSAGRAEAPRGHGPALYNTLWRDFSGSSVARILSFHCGRAQVQFLLRELRSHMSNKL